MLRELQTINTGVDPLIKVVNDMHTELLEALAYVHKNITDELQITAPVMWGSGDGCSGGPLTFHIHRGLDGDGGSTTHAFSVDTLIKDMVEEMIEEDRDYFVEIKEKLDSIPVALRVLAEELEVLIKENYVAEDED